MTAIATPVSTNTRSLPIFHIINLVLGLLVVVGFLALPWIHQPELGATSAQTLSTERSANEFGLPRDGLSLIPMAGIAAIALSVIGIFAQNYTRTISLLVGGAGLVGIVYFVSFGAALQANPDLNVLGVMGLGFWFAIVGVIGLILQALIPKPALPGYAVTKVLGNQESILALAFVALIIIVGIANPRFVADRNMLDILSGNAYIAVAAIGMSMVIISGNIDISVGSLIGVLAAVSGTLVVNDWPIWVSWVAPLIVGGLIGALIGFLVAYLRIPSIIVTLGMMSILKGGLIMVLGGAWITDMPEGYALAQMRPLGIPMPIIFMIGLSILATLWMRYNPTGRAIYAVGGNAEAARLSGISEKRTILTAFVLNGVFAGIASVLYATQLSVIQTTVPPNLELLIITATVVGGVSILGGTGTIIGSSIAAVLLNTIRSAMVFVNVSPFWLQAVQGVLILATVLVDILRRRRQRV
jgi:ribose/xylose/arabinose/galactoside ABC-type transport system permease subunit